MYIFTSSDTETSGNWVIWNLLCHKFFLDGQRFSLTPNIVFLAPRFKQIWSCKHLRNTSCTSYRACSMIIVFWFPEADTAWTDQTLCWGNSESKVDVRNKETLPHVLVYWKYRGNGRVAAHLRLKNFFIFFCGVGLTSPGTAATSGLLYSPRW
jgi:hypothetical protein